MITLIVLKGKQRAHSKKWLRVDVTSMIFIAVKEYF